MTHAHRSSSSSSRRRRTAALVAAAALSAAVLAPTAARAASGTWTGGAADGLWATPGNWTPAVPGATDGTAVSPDVATFTGTPASVAVTVDPNRNVAGLTFTGAALNGDDPASLPFTIGSTTGNPLTLSAGGTTQVTSSVSYVQGSNSNSTANETVAAPVRLAGPTYTFTNNAPTGVGLVFSGPVAPAGATPTTLTLDGSNIGVGSNTGSSQVTGNLTDGTAPGAILGIVKNGTGTWEIRGANTYSGDTVVNAGLLRFVNNTASESPSPNTHIIINSGGKVRFSGNTVDGSTVVPVAPAIEVRTGGRVETSNGTTPLNIKAEDGPALYFNFSSGAAGTTSFVTSTAPINLLGTTPEQGGIKLTATDAQATPVNLGGTTTPLDLGPVLRPFDISRTAPENTSYDLRVRGPVAGTGGILKLGPGTLRLDHASQTWSGTLDIREGTVGVSASGAMTGSVALSINGGDFHVYGDQTQTFSSVSLTKGSLSASNDASTVKSNSFTFDAAAGDTASADAVLADDTAPATLTKSGPGAATLSGPNTYTGAATVNAGTLVVTSSARGALLSSAGGVDIRGGQVVIDYTGGTTSAGTVASLLATSYASAPHFSAGQLRSSTADATHGLGYYDDGVSKLTVKYTYYGDLNLDGKVNADDYALIDRGRAAGLTGWANGDINYSGGAPDAADYLLMDTVFGTGGVAHDAWAALLAERQAEFGDAYVSQLVAAVPEPTSLAACGLAVLPLVRRRRRK